jgi:hypothetical protein
MSDTAVKRLALVLALEAEILGMRYFNEERLALGQAPGYLQENFDGMAEQLRAIAEMPEEEL